MFDRTMPYSLRQYPNRRQPCTSLLRSHVRPMRVILAASVLLATGPAFSQAFTAGDLQRMCAAPAQAAACATYIQGYVTGRNLSLPKPTICVPPGKSLRDAVTGFLDYMAKNPIEARLDAGLVLGNQLLASYPCPAR